MCETSWQHFPHGGDIGVRGIGATAAEAFAEAGAPMVFVEAPQSDAELERIAAAYRGSGVLNAANVVEGSSKTPIHTVRELHAMGFTMAMFPVGARVRAP